MEERKLQIEKKQRDIILYLIGVLRKNWLFFFAFAGMAVYLKITGPMNNVSADAADIWKTIKSFYSGDIVPSYVLYKGFAAVYPYVWLYQLSLLFGVGEFFFIKLFHCLLFAYVSTIGFPYLIEKLLHIKPKIWRKALLVLLLFWFWKSNHAFDQLMVDLPSLAYFIMLVNSALKISLLNGKRSYGRYIYTGLLLGLNLCISGQYTAAALCIILYIIIKTIPFKVLKEKSQRWSALICVIVMLISVALVQAGNKQFEESVTNPLRKEGAWIPSGQDWLEYGFTRLLGVQRSWPGPTIPDYRGLSIAKDLYGDQYEEMYKRMVAGGVSLNIGQYFTLVSKYPIDFLIRYGNRLFIALSPDGGRLSFTQLFLAYTLLFTALIIFKNHCKTAKHFFSANILIILSFILAIAASIILNIEMRFVMQIQGLIYAAALLDDSLWNGLKAFWETVKQCFVKKTLQSLANKPLPYLFALYVVFMFFCLMHISSQYEMLGVSQEILFNLI
jgi:hypothetical protein